MNTCRRRKPSVSNIDRLLAWGSSTTGRKLLKFAATSAVSTVISGTLLVVIYGARLITSEVLATLVANLLAMLPAYHLVRRWACGKRGRSHWRREVAPYVGMSLLGTSFSLIGANIAHHLVHTHTGRTSSTPPSWRGPISVASRSFGCSRSSSSTASSTWARRRSYRVGPGTPGWVSRGSW